MTLALVVLFTLGAKWATPSGAIPDAGHAAALGLVMLATWLPATLLLGALARREPDLEATHSGLLARWLSLAVGLAVLHVAAVEGLLKLFGMAGQEAYGSPPRDFAVAFRLHFHESLLLLLATAVALLGNAWRSTATARGAGLGRLARELRRARLGQLRSQLEPHFLLNTLSSISAEIQTDPVAADRMICSLGDFLRGTLATSGATEVPLAQELELASRYAAVERLRFGARLELSIVASPETRQLRVPPLILQPLVENAVRHGVARSLAPVRIEIRAELREGRLRLAVVDDAAPPPPGPRAVSGGGIGLSNVRGRLAQLYGEAARLETRRLEAGGFESLVELPLRVGESTEPDRGPRSRPRRWRWRRAA